MDDVGFVLTLMCGSGSSIGVRLLPLAVISGPTSGDGWLADVYEWYAQVRRWAVGTSDNFHFFLVHLPSLPLLPALRFALGYFLYYGLVLCSASLFAVFAALLPCLYPEHTWDEAGAVEWLPGGLLSSISSRQWLLILTLAPYPLYSLMFLLDRLWVHHVLRVDEPMPVWRNVLHFVLTPPILLLLSLVQLYGYVVVAAKGKAACTHHLAGKAALNHKPVAK